ncbi:hypothetical protein [Xenophilus azovorans]|nr:hypothetical protein [Xenophilus azovorans]
MGFDRNDEQGQRRHARMRRPAGGTAPMQSTAASHMVDSRSRSTR